MKRAVQMVGGGNRRYNNTRLGEFLRAICSHPLLVGVPRHTVRAAMRQCSARPWKTVGHAPAGDMKQPFVVEPLSAGVHWDDLACFNEKHGKIISFRRLYVCEYPDIFHVRAILSRLGNKTRCRTCGRFFSVAEIQPIPSFNAPAVVCDGCAAKTYARRRRVSRLAASAFNKDEALAEAHLLLRELKQEIRKRA